MTEPTDFRDMAQRLDGCCAQVGELIEQIQRRTSEVGSSPDLEVLVESPLARLMAAVQQLQCVAAEWSPAPAAPTDPPPSVEHSTEAVADTELVPGAEAEAEEVVAEPDPGYDDAPAGDADQGEDGADVEHTGTADGDGSPDGEAAETDVASGDVEEHAASETADTAAGEAPSVAQEQEPEAATDQTSAESTDVDGDADSGDRPRQGRREPGAPRGAGRCALRGFSASLPIPSLLGLLSSHRKSGTLRITTAQETFTLEIQEGDVVHACTDSSRADQLLGSILVARDSIDPEQLEEFFKQFVEDRSGSDKIGEALERAQLVSRTDLKHALEHQVQELFHRLFAADHAAFYFYEGSEMNIEQRIRMNVTRLLLESARTRDESMARMA